eukprot:scaffold30979_cov86-Cyclotella_meneghiniana.AAC.3
MFGQAEVESVPPCVGNIAASPTKTRLGLRKCTPGGGYALWEFTLYRAYARFYLDTIERGRRCGVKRFRANDGLSVVNRIVVSSDSLGSHTFMIQPSPQTSTVSVKWIVFYGDMERIKVKYVEVLRCLCDLRIHERSDFVLHCLVICESTNVLIWNFSCLFDDSTPSARSLHQLSYASCHTEGGAKVPFLLCRRYIAAHAVVVSGVASPVDWSERLWSCLVLAPEGHIVNP